MILYLTTQNANTYLDFLNLKIKKLIGCFSLSAFLLEEINNIENVEEIVIHSAACKETFIDIADVIKTYQRQKNSHRVTVLCPKIDLFNERLEYELIKKNIHNIACATTVEKLTEEIRECLSPFGMQKYFVKLGDLYEKALSEEKTQYFDLYNINKSVSINSQPLPQINKIVQPQKEKILKPLFFNKNAYKKETEKFIAAALSDAVKFPTATIVFSQYKESFAIFYYNKEKNICVQRIELSQEAAEKELPNIVKHLQSALDSRFIIDYEFYIKGATL